MKLKCQRKENNLRMNKFIILAVLFVPLAILIALGAHYYNTIVEILDDELHYEPGPNAIIEEEIKAAFQRADVDDSGSLNEVEFSQTIKKLLKHGLFGMHPEKNNEKQSLEEDALHYVKLKENFFKSLNPQHVENEITSLKVQFTPFVLNSLSKHEKGSFNDAASDIHFQGLISWTRPNMDVGFLPPENFSVFLPPKNIGDKVGIPWYMVGEEPYYNEDMDNNHYRYYPKEPNTAAERMILTLLYMFHPRPFLNLRFGPRGTIACVRAYTNDLVDIEFRIHAEFQINEPPQYPFWFTPAQFAGHIVMSKDGKSVKYFKMELPNTLKLNIDMEWITGIKNIKDKYDSWNMEVDIGYQPELSMESNGSTPLLEEPTELIDINTIKWTSEISESEARGIIEKKFYPFKEVPYHPYNESFEVAKKHNKLVHLILLWGTLADQAC